jgi:uncharacterized protein
MATANAPERASTHREGLLARHPLVCYFLIAYAGTWLVTVPVALSANGVGLLPFGIPDGSVIFVSAAWVFLGPSLAALVVTGATEGRAGVGRLLRRYVLWRVGLRWCLVVIFGPPVVILLVTILLPGALASFRTLAPLAPLPLLVSFPLILIFGGALFEEGEWRGFALPRLQSSCGNPHPRDTLGGLAPAPVLDHGLGYASHDCQHGSIFPLRCLHDRSLYVGLQQHERQHTPRHSAARVL